MAYVSLFLAQHYVCTLRIVSIRLWGKQANKQMKATIIVLNTTLSRLLYKIVVCQHKKGNVHSSTISVVFGRWTKVAQCFIPFCYIKEQFREF